MDFLRVGSGEGFDALEGRDQARPLLLEVVPNEGQTEGFWERW